MTRSAYCIPVGGATVVVVVVARSRRATTCADSSQRCRDVPRVATRKVQETCRCWTMAGRGGVCACRKAPSAGTQRARLAKSNEMSPIHRCHDLPRRITRQVIYAVGAVGANVSRPIHSLARGTRRWHGSNMPTHGIEVARGFISLVVACVAGGALISRNRRRRSCCRTAH
jgi:hypothetical protein